MTITTEVKRTFQCDGWDCTASARQRGKTEAELKALAFPEGWTVRINRDRAVFVVEHLCPSCSIAPPCPKGCPCCLNEACGYCGAGCWQSPGMTACDHDVTERHQKPDLRFMGLPLDHPAWKANGPEPTSQ